MRNATKGIRSAPSAEHLCMLVGRTAEETAKLIVAFQDEDVAIRTWQASDYLRAFLDGADYDFLIGQAKRHKNKFMGNAAVETLPLVRQYKQENSITWFQPLGPIRLVLSKTLEVNLRPLGLAGINGETILVCGQVWKHRALNAFSYQLWRSMLQVYLDTQLDIDGFHWLEMSAPGKGLERELSIRSHDTVQAFTPIEMAAYLGNIDGAMRIVRSVPSKKKEKPSDPHQGDFGV